MVDRVRLQKLASFDGSVQIDASDLKELLAELKAAEKKTVASLFEQLEEFGAGEMYFTGCDENGKMLTALIIAKEENAKMLMAAYKRMSEEGEHGG